MGTTADRRDTPDAPAPLHGAPRSVAVIGAGITGLVTAWELMRRGLPVTLYESTPHAGGAIRTTHAGDWLAEHGPNSLLTSAPVEELIRLLDLEADVVVANPEANRRYIVRDGRPVAIPMSPPAFLTTPLLSLRAKLRVLFEPLVGRGPTRDVVAGAVEDESIASFVRRRLGREVLDYAVNPFVAGIFAGVPEELSMAHAFPRVYALEREHGSLSKGLVQTRRAAGRARKRGGSAPGTDASRNATGEAPARAARASSSAAAAAAAGSAAARPVRPRLISFRNGLQTLPDALARALGKTLQTTTPLRSLHRGEHRWELELGDDDAVAVRTVDAVVLAVPAHALAALELPASIRKFSAPVEHVTYPPVSVLTLGFRRGDVTHPLDGFGMLVPAVERRSVLGVLFSSTLFPDRAPDGDVALTVFIGGARQPELATRPTDALVDVALTDLRELLGVRGAPSFTHHVFWPRGIPQYVLGYGQVKDAIRATEAAHPGLYLTGNFRQGVSVGDCIASGEAVADEVAAYLAARE